MKGRRRRTACTKILRAAAGCLAALILFLILSGVFLVLGGAKIVIELALPAAMNGYVTVDRASYSYFGPARATDMAMVLDWGGEQETVVTARKIKTWPRLLPLLRGRLEFGATTIEDAALNLRILPSGLANIDRLFRLEPSPPEPVIQVFPPHHAEVRNLQFSFPPFIYRPIRIDKVIATFYPINYKTLELAGFGKLSAPLVGTGSFALYLDIDDEEYAVVYEGCYTDLDLKTMERLPVSPAIRLPHTLLPAGRVKISAVVAGRGDKVNRAELTVELDQLDVHSLQYPLSLVNATGKFTIDRQSAQIVDFQGVLPLGGKDATLQASGIIHQDNTTVFDAALTNVEITDDVIAFLPALNKIRDFVSINGECSLTAKVYDKQGWTIPRTWCGFLFRGQVLPVDYPIPAYDIKATLRTMPRGTVIVDDLTLELGSGITRSAVAANGSFDTILNAIQIFFSSAGITVNNDLLARLPQIPGLVSQELRIEGLIPVTGEYIHASEGDVFAARAELIDFDVLVSRFPEVGARGLNASFQISGNHLSINELAAEMLSGGLKLDLDMNLSRDNRSFRSDIHLTDFDLGKLPRDMVEGLTGILNADFHFEGAQPTLPALLARADVSLKEGSFARLPLLISIINFLNLQLPGRVVFTSGRAKFHVQEEVLMLDRLELYSDVLSLYAKGWVAFDGRIKIRAGLRYQRPLLKGVPIIGPIVRLFVGAIRSALSTVDVAGTVADPKIRLVSVRYLTSPISAVVSFFAEEEE